MRRRERQAAAQLPMFDSNGLLDRRYTLLPPGVDLFENQKQLLPHISNRDNVLILWKTSSGKSTAVPLLGTQELDRGKNILYVASFKALADEKYEEWGEPDQPWEHLPRTSITGDYSYDAAKIKEIQKARLISITPESLVSCIRNQGSDKSQFLTNVGIIFIDECFTGGTRVWLPDGTRRTIESLVNKKYSGNVVSWDSKTEKYVEKRVTGWVKKKPTNPMVSFFFGGVGGINCTANHEIYTMRGKVPAGMLRPGDMVLAHPTNSKGGDPFTEEENQVLLGSMVGDGCLTYPHENTPNPRFVITQGEKQRDYALFKTRFFQESNSFAEGRINSGYTGDHSICRFAMRQNPLLGEYKSLSKMQVIERLDDLGWAILYMDDGSLGKNKSCRISINSFTFEEADHTANVLAKRGYESAIWFTSRDNKYPEIEFNVSDTRRFHERIAQYVPDCMRYKLVNTQEYTPCVTPPLTTVESEEHYCRVTKVESADDVDWVYCLEVEDTHNFVVGGGYVVSNCHLVAEPGRGASMEAAIIELLQDKPDIRLVGMSGTIPNWQEYADWMTQLNGRPTHICRSDFRPVVLKQHFLKFTPGTSKMSEAERRHKIEAIITSEEHESKQFLVCFFKKKFGNDVIDSLKSRGVNAEFHSADIKELSLRQSMEKRFKRATTRVLGCTQTLITGVNLPAWGVIITATENGGGEIPAYTLQQAAGRAGRPKYDTEGNVWFLIPDDGKGSYDYHVRRIRLGEEIKSQMIHKEVVATHFLGALYLERFKNLKDFDQWYHRTLAYVQGNMSETEVKELLLGIVDDMQKRGMIKTEATSGAIELRNKGKICAQLLLDPYFFADMIANFRMYFTVSKPNDVDLAIAMTRSSKFYSQWMTFEERQAVPDVISKSPLKQEYWKHAAAVYHALQGKTFKDFPFVLSNALYQVREDLDRTCLAMVRVCNESEMWTEEVFDTRGRKQKISADEKIRLMFLRVKHGYTWERSRGMIAGLSRSEMNALNSVGITDIESARKNVELASKVMKESRMKELRIA